MRDLGIFEVIPIRFYMHCGWAIQVDPTFESQLMYEGETLRIYEPGDKREIYLSSMQFRRHDGKPFTAEEVLVAFPPPEMTGLHYKHLEGDFKGAALWMFGDDDIDGPAWVLMGVVVSEEHQKLARCTIVCSDESDHAWALRTWRSVMRAGPKDMPNVIVKPEKPD